MVESRSDEEIIEGVKKLINKIVNQQWISEKEIRCMACNNIVHPGESKVVVGVESGERIGHLGTSLICVVVCCSECIKPHVNSPKTLMIFKVSEFSDN